MSIFAIHTHEQIKLVKRIAHQRKRVRINHWVMAKFLTFRTFLNRQMNLKSMLSISLRIFSKQHHGSVSEIALQVHASSSLCIQHGRNNPSMQCMMML